MPPSLDTSATFDNDSQPSWKDTDHIDSAHDPSDPFDAFYKDPHTSASVSRAHIEFPIAIVGISCRFAGDATSASKLWNLCIEGKDGWSPIPKDRFNADAWWHEDPSTSGRTNVKGGYFLKEDIALWDANFFKFSTELATALDPQIRQLLEAFYEATEDAGMPVEQLAGTNTSVFTGIFSKDYHEICARDPDVLAYSTSGVGSAMLSNRISHFFDLRGASMSIDTGCSASMVALHQACRSIWARDSDISVVAGADALLNHDSFIAMSTMGVLSPEGKCFAWDSRASGFGRGEGVAALILKPLDDALRDGDRVHAVIKASGLNQDGNTPTIASPSMEAQVRLIEETYQRAGLDIRETAYVEAHMTGTGVGDPIEAEALARTFGKSRAGDDPIWVGSVKTNIGHTEPVSGIASIIKTAYALRNRVIPPNLNYQTPHKNIPLHEWHLQVPTAAVQWPADKALRASVNNFGYGGTNAHVIMERAPEASFRATANGNTQSHSIGAVNGHDNHANGVTTGNGHSNDHSSLDQPRIYLLSAKDSRAAGDMAKAFASHIRRTLADSESPTPSDLAHTLSNRRSLHHWVIAVSASTLEELCERWEAPATKAINSERKPVKKLGFVFNGQGAQWHAMARELIDTYPVFEQRLRLAGSILQEFGAEWSLSDELMKDEQSTRVHEVDLSQPSTVAIQLCLVDLLRSWGITPSAVTSHSSGEIAAAYAIGALSFKEALGVIFYRGQLALQLTKLEALHGAMAAVGVGVEDVQVFLRDLEAKGKVCVACINSPSSVTISGDSDAIDEVVAKIAAESIFVRKLKVPLAYHSHHMTRISGEYTSQLKGFLHETARNWEGVLFASPVTGGLVTSPKVLSPAHWALNLTSPVLFEQAFGSMCFGSDGDNTDMIIEIGAHSTLAGPIRQILKSRNVEMPYVSCLKRQENAVHTMHDVVIELLKHQYPVRLAAVNLENAKNATFVPDLPTYPWNHRTRYWDEPRISKQTRHKKHAPHELIGSTFPMGPDNKPTWRNFLRLSDLDWMRDHQLGNKVIAPGAYYITSAIEAIRLLTDPSEETISGYRLRDVEILNALAVPESAAVEIQLSLRKCNQKELEHASWYEFDINSLGASDMWVENCKGYVSVEMRDVVKAATTRDLKPPNEDDYLLTNAQAVDKIDIPSVFSRLHEIGIRHGPHFQNLLDCQASGARSITTFKIADVASATYDYAIHPTTLDSIFQTTFCSMPDQKNRQDLLLPRAIRSLYIPRQFNREGGQKLRAFTEHTRLNRRGLTCNISVINGEKGLGTNEAFVQLEDFFCQAVPREIDDEESGASPICSRSTWELDILHNMPADIKQSMTIPMEDEEIEEERRRVQASFYLIHDAVLELESGGHPNTGSWIWHHKMFYEWMKSIVASAEDGSFRPSSRIWSKASKGMRQRLYDELETSTATDKLLIRVGSNLAAICRGQVTTLELMMEGGLLHQYYADNTAAIKRILKQCFRITELYAMKHAGAKVLEIGGGTGAATGTILEAFGSRARREGLDGSLIDHYMFTDISAGFFAAAKEKFAAYDALMDFKPLDIEQDPVGQGFGEASYDLVVAVMVLHATKNLQRTLLNVRRLLKPGGKLLLIESTKDRLDTQVAFGSLPGWWLSEEDNRKGGPNASVEDWNEALKATGFSGADFNLYEYAEVEFQSANLMMATALDSEPFRGPITIVHDNTQSPPQAWLSYLSKLIDSATGIAPSVQVLDELKPEGQICIFTSELERPFLDGIHETNFERLRHMLVHSRGVLWLSAGGLFASEKPSFAATQGLLRTLRIEDTSKRFAHLDFEPNSDGETVWTEDKINHIIHVLQQAFKYTLSEDGTDFEFVVTDDKLHVARIITDKIRSQICAGDDTEIEGKLEAFVQPDRSLVWETSKSGMLSDLYFVDKFDSDGPIPNGWVEVEGRAFGLNFRDVLIALGQLNETLFAHEAGAVVTGLGPDTEESGLKIGDRVSCLAHGQFASKSRTPWTSVAKIPDDMSFEWAAAIPVAYFTAYHSLFHIARVEKGETVLVHAAAGGFGQAAVVLAQYAGAEVFATCSSQEKRRLLHEQYNVPLDHILSSRDASFAPEIMAMTKGRGIDIVLNSLAGPLLKATWDCIARFGRFIEVGKADMDAARKLDMTPFRRCAMHVSVDMMQLREYKPLIAREALVESIRICHERSKPPMVPITSHSISEMEKAMRVMQAGTHLGKIVLIPGIQDQVKVISRLQPVSLNEDDAIYLIIGGVTGIGTAVTKWMISKGAKNLLLVSRHATKHPNGTILQAEGKASGCQIHLRDCDIADEKKLISLLADCAQNLPPIRGVINGAMVLDDTVFEHMRYEQWINGIRSKINSTSNLHKHLPKDIRFFVTLASALGVGGGMSQANYSAGNAYQDALSRRRTKLGLPGVTIDLCVIRKVGYVEDQVETGNSTLVDRLGKLGIGQVDVDAVLRLLEDTIREPRRESQPASQIIMGLTENSPECWSKEFGVRERRFETLCLAKRRGAGGYIVPVGDAGSRAALVRALSAADATVEKAAAVLVDALVTKLSEIFNIPLEEIDVNHPLAKYGVDSLVAVEIRNWLSSTVKAKVSVFEILQSASLTNFGTLLATRSEYMAGKFGTVPEAGTETDTQLKDDAKTGYTS